MFLSLSKHIENQLGKRIKKAFVFSHLKANKCESAYFMRSHGPWGRKATRAHT